VVIITLSIKERSGLLFITKDLTDYRASYFVF
jgi:hypothetical protein